MPCYNDWPTSEEQAVGLLCEVIKAQHFGRAIPDDLSKNIASWFDSHRRNDKNKAIAWWTENIAITHPESVPPAQPIWTNPVLVAIRDCDIFEDFNQVAKDAWDQYRGK